jgi:(p)ppGpp synthase/HD superfamily hydrolase
MTPRYTQALTLASTAHEGQFIKGTKVPYITHPVGVARLVAIYGGDEDQQIGGLLHDTVEDGGAQYIQLIKTQFGQGVLDLVMGCTDAVPDENGRKGPWQHRKQTYLNHLPTAGERILLVSACDKLYNARAIVADLQTIGDEVFKRFTGKKEGTLWYYETLGEIYEKVGSPVAVDMRAAVNQMKMLAGAANQQPAQSTEGLQNSSIERARQ